MAQFRTDLLWTLGFAIQGDLGPLTTYTNRRGNLVYFDKAPPLNPPSQLQEIIKNRFKQTATAWRALTEQKRKDWQTAADKSYANVTGYNLFTYWTLTMRKTDIQTIERQSGIQLLS